VFDFGNKGCASCSNSFKAHKILTMASISILEELCFYRNSKCEPKGRMWNCKEMFLAGSILKCSQRSYAFLRFLFPLPCRRTFHSLLNTVHFRMGMNAHVFSILKDNVQTVW
jgi:hypothetical protein